jgi:hypothetical protein
LRQPAVLLGHLRAGDHVDQDPNEREHEDQDDPARLSPSRQVVAAEDVAEHRDEDPDRHEPEEKSEQPP